MSIPASLRTGPNTTNVLARKRYMLIYILLLWLSLLPVTSLIWMLFANSDPSEILIYLPFSFLGWYFLFMMDTIIFCWIALKIVNLIHKPREGYFPRNKNNKDYKYWSLRGAIKKLAFWASHNCLLPWIDILAFKMFGVKLRGGIALFDAWVDSEFIEIGKGSLIGQGAILMSSMITTDWLIIRKIKIGDGVLIGSHTVIAPGTKVGDNTVIGAVAQTTVGQELEPNWVYVGSPARKYRKNEYLSIEESDIEMARKRQMFKQYLTVEDLQELESLESEKEEKIKKKIAKEKKKKERKIERQEKKYNKQQQKIEELKELEAEADDAKERTKIQEKIDKIKEKEQKIKEKMKELLVEQELIKQAYKELGLSDSGEEIPQDDEVESD